MPATKHAIVQQLSFISEVDHATLRDQARAPSVAQTSSPLPFAKGEDEGEGFSSRSLRVRTRLPARRCQVLGEPDDSRIAIHELHAVASNSERVRSRIWP